MTHSLGHTLPLRCAIRARRPLSHYSYPETMAPRARVVSNSSTGSGSSPSRPPSESPIEVAYNTAVQSFVRRDHLRTHGAISTLLKLLETDVPKLDGSKWYELKEGENEGYEWRIKVLKLVISAYASLYSDPSNNTSDLPEDIKGILPPSSPDRALARVLEICQSTLKTDNLLPPQLISTLILASLKLKPSTPALDFAHRVTESWVSDIPDDYIRVISTSSSNSSKSSSIVTHAAGMKKRIESTREAYLKVIELFVGEVLAREGEFEMARAFLDGEDVLGSKRKENLYRHLRTIESRSKSSGSSSTTGSSPSNSGILPVQSPSSSLVLPSPDTSRPQSRTGNRSTAGGRSRSSSTSSSSSERTARPRAAIKGNSTTGVAPVSASKRTVGGGLKGKEREGEKEVETGSVDTNSTLPVPKRIYVNASPPSGSGSSRRNNNHQSKGKSSLVQRNINSIIDLIPISIKQRITSPSFLLTTILPIPLVVILLAIWIRRKRNRLFASIAGAAIGAGSEGGARIVNGVAGSVVTADAVRQRLERVRQRGGLRGWVIYWVRWWITKLVGVVKMGTTISYL